MGCRRAKAARRQTWRSGGGRLSDLAYTHILEHLFDRRLPVSAFVSHNGLVALLAIPVSAPP
jgi:hypothetical protein